MNTEDDLEKLREALAPVNIINKAYSTEIKEICYELAESHGPIQYDLTCGAVLGYHSRDGEVARIRQDTGEQIRALVESAERHQAVADTLRAERAELVEALENACDTLKRHNGCAHCGLPLDDDYDAARTLLAKHGKEAE